MFEQFETREKSARRAGTFLLGYVVVAALVALAVLSSRLWPNTLPQIITKVTAPIFAPRLDSAAPPENRAPITKVVAVVPHGPLLAAPRKKFALPPLHEPSAVPNVIAKLNEKDVELPGGPAIPGNACPTCIQVVGAVPNCVGPDCVLGLGITGNFAPTAPPPPPALKPAPKKASMVQEIRVGGNVQSAKLIQAPRPAYPPLARVARVSGVVRLAAIIAPDGTIQHLEVVAERGFSLYPLLVQAAMDAVKHWLYQPTLLNGEPVAVATTIDVNFTLN